MNYITNEDGADGFGSQLLAKISAIIYANYHNLDYVHFHIQKIVLEDNPSQSRNNELNDANIMVNNIMKNLQVKTTDDLVDTDVVYSHHRLDFYKQLNSNPEKYYTSKVLEKLKNSYTKEKPDFYLTENLNIAIHIRRGNDIRVNDSSRYVSSDLYDKVIESLLKKYENAIIHIFSWNDPQLKITSDRIVYHITSDGGEEFISHFNALVHSDILLVGSSTFSISAGFFNKNKVLYSKQLSRIDVNPHPPAWETNFNDLIGNL